mgnify:CR=1 FL=1
MGSGTTAVAAKMLGKNFIGFEINMDEKYIERFYRSIDYRIEFLEKLKKEAKVTTGANTLFTEIESLMKAGGTGSDTQLESIFNKINFF